MKVYLIIIIIAAIYNKYAISQVQCPVNCLSCKDFGSETPLIFCKECKDTFFLSNDKTYCISTCYDNSYYNPQTNQCETTCTRLDQFADKKTKQCSDNINCPKIRKVGEVFPSSITSLYFSSQHNLLLAVLKDAKFVLAWDLQDGKIKGRISTKFFDSESNKNDQIIQDIIIPDQFSILSKYSTTGFFILQYRSRIKVYDIQQGQMIDYLRFDGYIKLVYFDINSALIFYQDIAMKLNVYDQIQSRLIFLIDTQTNSTIQQIIYNSNFNLILLNIIIIQEDYEEYSELQFIDLITSTNLSKCTFPFIKQIIKVENKYNLEEQIYIIDVMDQTYIQLISKKTCELGKYQQEIEYQSNEIYIINENIKEGSNIIEIKQYFLIVHSSIDNDLYRNIEIYQLDLQNNAFKKIFDYKKDQLYDIFYKISITTSVIENNTLEFIVSIGNFQHFFYKLNLIDESLDMLTFVNNKMFYYDFLLKTKEQIYIYFGQLKIIYLKQNELLEFDSINIITNFNQLSEEQYQDPEFVTQLYEDLEDKFIIYYDSLNFLVKVIDINTSRILSSIRAQIISPLVFSFTIFQSNGQKYLALILEYMKVFIISYKTFVRIDWKSFSQEISADAKFLQSYKRNGELVIYSSSCIFKIYIDENGKFQENYEAYEDNNNIQINQLIYFEDSSYSLDETYIYILSLNNFSIIPFKSSNLKIAENINPIYIEGRQGISKCTIDEQKFMNKFNKILEYMIVTSKDGLIMVVNKYLEVIIKYDFQVPYYKCLQPYYYSDTQILCQFQWEYMKNQESTLQATCFGFIDIDQKQFKCQIIVIQPQFVSFDRQKSILSYLFLQDGQFVQGNYLLQNNKFYDQFFKTLPNIDIQDLYSFSKSENKKEYITDKNGQIKQFRVFDQSEQILKLKDSEANKNNITLQVLVWTRYGFVIEITKQNIFIYCLLMKQLIYSTAQENQSGIFCQNTIRDVTKSIDGVLIFICKDKLYYLIQKQIMRFKLNLINESTLSNGATLIDYIRFKDTSQNLIIFYSDMSIINYSYEINTEKVVLELKQTFVYEKFQGKIVQTLLNFSKQLFFILSNIQNQYYVMIYQLKINAFQKLNYLSPSKMNKMITSETNPLLVISGSSFLFVIDLIDLNRQKIVINISDKNIINVKLIDYFILLRSQKAIYSYYTDDIQSNYNNNITPIRFFTSGNIMSFVVIDDRIAISTDYIIEVQLFVFQIYTGNIIDIIPSNINSSYFTDLIYDRYSDILYAVDHNGQISTVRVKMGYQPYQKLSTIVSRSNFLTSTSKPRLIYDGRRNILVSWSDCHINNGILPTVQELSQSTFYWDNESNSAYIIDQNTILWIMTVGKQLVFLYEFQQDISQIEIIYANLKDNIVIVRSDARLIILKNNSELIVKDIFSLYNTYLIIENLVQNQKLELNRQNLSKIFLLSRTSQLYSYEVETNQFTSIYTFKSCLKIIKKLNTKFIITSDSLNEVIILNQSDSKIIQTIDLKTEQKMNKLIDIQEVFKNGKELFLMIDQQLLLVFYEYDSLTQKYIYNAEESHQIFNLLNYDHTERKGMLDKVKYDLQHSRIFLMNDYVSYIQIHYFTFQQNEEIVIEAPDIDFQLEIFDNFLFIFNTYQINIYRRSDLTFFSMYKQSFELSQLLHIYQVKYNLFLLNWNNQNTLIQLKEQTQQDSSSLDISEQNDSISTIILNKESYIIISFIYQQQQEEIQIISISQNQIYDQKFIVKIGIIENCYINIFPKNSYELQNSFDNLVYTLSTFEMQLKHLAFNVFIQDLFLKSAFSLDFSDYIEIRYIGLSSVPPDIDQNLDSLILLDKLNEGNIEQLFLSKKILVADAKNIIGIYKYTMKNVSLQFFLESELQERFQTNHIGFGRDAKEVILQNILISDQKIINAQFDVTNLDLLYIDNLIVKNCFLFNTSLFNIKGVKTVSISNILVVDSKFKMSHLIEIEQGQNITIQNVTFQNNNIVDLFSTFITIKNSTQTLFKNMTLSRNTNSLNIYDFVNTEMSSSLIRTKMLVITTESFKVIYLIKLYIVQRIFIVNSNLIENLNTQLIFVSSTLSQDELQTSLFNSTIVIDKLKMKDNKLYFNEDNYREEIEQKQKMIDINDNTKMKYSNISTIGFTFIQIAQSIIKLNECEISNNLSDISSGIVQIIWSISINIMQSNFTNNLSAEGGALYIQSQSISYINNCILLSNVALFSGGAILIKESTQLSVFNSVIQDNISLFGGAVRVGQKSSIFFDEDTLNFLSKNEAAFQGDNFFNMNTLTLKIVSIHCFYPDSSNALGQTYPDNQNNNSQDDSMSLDEQTDDEIQNECFDVIVEQPPLFDSNPQNKMIKSMRSGRSLTFIIQVQDQSAKIFTIPSPLASYHNITTTEFSQINICIKPVNDQLIIQNDVLTNLQRYSSEYKGFILENVQFKIKQFNYSSIDQEQIHSFYIELNSFTGNVSQLISKIDYDISVRPCQQGEIYIKELSNGGGVICLPCEKGSYSLENPMLNIKNESSNSTLPLQCKECPTSAYFCSLNKIFIKDGFWRSSNDTDAILSCSNEPTNCLAQTLKNQDNVCKEGHIGPLCESCDNFGTIWKKQYVANQRFKCVECQKAQKLNVFILVGLLMIGTTLYLYFQVMNHNQSVLCQQLGYYIRMMDLASIYTSCFRNRNRYKIKILIYFLQITNSINKIEFYIPSLFNFFTQTLGSPSTQLVVQSQCILLKQPNSYEWTIPLMYSQRILAFLSPFIYWLGIVFLNYFLVYFKLVSSQKTFITTSFVLLSLFLQPNVIALLAPAMSCRRIGDKFYIQSDIQYDCFDDYHSNFVYFFFIPAIALWMIVPLIFLKQLATCSSKKRESFQMLYKYGYLYSEYKSKYFFWEFIKILLRMQSLISTTLFSDYYQQIQTFNLLLFILYLIALFRIQPYYQQYFANLDLFTNVLIIFMILLNLQHQYYLTENHQSVILSIFWMSIFLSYIVCVGYSILSEYYKVFLLPFLIQKLEHLSKSFDFVGKIYGHLDNSQRINQVNIFKRWKLIQINLKYLIFLKQSRQMKQNVDDTIRPLVQSPISPQSDVNFFVRNIVNPSQFKPNILNYTEDKKLINQTTFAKNTLNNKSNLSSSNSIFSDNSPQKTIKNIISSQQSQLCLDEQSKTSFSNSIHQNHNEKHSNKIEVKSDKISIQEQEEELTKEDQQIQDENDKGFSDSSSNNSELFKISSITRNFNSISIQNLNIFKLKVEDKNRNTSATTQQSSSQQ